jgi:hypothetical protein
MSIFRYLLQGAGWEIGRSAAREGIEALSKNADDTQNETEAPEVTAAEERRRARAARVAVKKREAELERQLAELKKKAGR